VTASTGLEEPLPIYLEAGSKRVFACAVHWFGWCRVAKTEGLAIDALLGYCQRYGEVVT
jgi:hypothetical protein